MNSTPVFIHSLFRTGSTYFFNVFRRSSAGYWCYQEPLHELVLNANENPEHLHIDQEDDLVKTLRHPDIGGEYFRELLESWPAWKDKLTDKAIYDSYFAPPNDDIGVSYLRALKEAAKGRPVFQECRTVGRIAAIKEALGGIHLFLWRNPWDQWWSYKATPYFSVANLLIVNAPNAPKPVRLMRDDLHIEDWAHTSVKDGFNFYWDRAITAEESYLIFYLLWCLALNDGKKNADLTINIDHISDSKIYQDAIQTSFSNIGIEGIDLSDCRVPQGLYLERDRAFFAPLEEKVHKWLEEGGWPQQDIDDLRVLRREFQPVSWNVTLTDPAHIGAVEQASRARSIVNRLETAKATRATADAKVISETANRLREATTSSQEAEARALQAEAREAGISAQLQQALAVAQQAQAQQQQADARAHQAEAREAEISIQLQQALAVAEQAQFAESRAARAESQLAEAQQQLTAMHRVNNENWQLAQQQSEHVQAVHKSTSWRITAPLRSAKLIASQLVARVGAMRQALQDSEATVCGVRRLALKRLVSYAQRSPRFKRIALRMLSFSPRLTVKLRRIYLQASYSQNSNYLDSPMDVEPITHEQISPTIDIYGEYNNRPAVEGLNAGLRTPLEKYFHARRVEK